MSDLLFGLALVGLFEKGIPYFVVPAPRLRRLMALITDFRSDIVNCPLDTVNAAARFNHLFVVSRPQPRRRIPADGNTSKMQ